MRLVGEEKKAQREWASLQGYSVGLLRRWEGQRLEGGVL